MAKIVKIPKWDWTEGSKENRIVGKPAWARVHRIDADGKEVTLKPLIRCNCGEWSGIGLHHVHADGRVTASFFHATAAELAKMPDGGRFSPGCGWHVHLQLLDYDLGDFPPDPPRPAPKAAPTTGALTESEPRAAVSPIIARAEQLLGWR